jgi:hypothetical protein
VVYEVPTLTPKRRGPREDREDAEFAEGFLGVLYAFSTPRFKVEVK